MFSLAKPRRLARVGIVTHSISDVALVAGAVPRSSVGGVFVDCMDLIAITSYLQTAQLRGLYPMTTERPGYLACILSSS